MSKNDNICTRKKERLTSAERRGQASLDYAEAVKRRLKNQ